MNLFARWVGRLTHPLGAALLLLLVCFGLHRSALSGGWQFDDGAHLLMAAKYAPWQYFFVPEVMLESTYAHISPWNVFFYEMGLPFFGLNPVGHYVHLLLVLWGVAYATFFLLGEWLPKPYALFGAVLFLAMPPVAGVAQMLMVGHYVYGLLFTVLALLAFNRAVLTGQTRYALLTAGLYALACLCKELYVPLPAVLLFLPVKTWPVRLRSLLGVAVVAVAYIGFRWWVLGGGGGQGPVAALAFPDGASWLRLQQSLFGNQLRGKFAAAVFVLGTLWLLYRGGWRMGVWCAVVLGMLLMPLILGTGLSFAEDAIRYAFVIAWAVDVASAEIGVLLTATSLAVLALPVGVFLLAVMLSAHGGVRSSIAAKGLGWVTLNRWVLNEVSNPRQALFIDNEPATKSLAQAKFLMGFSVPRLVLTRNDVEALPDTIDLFAYDAGCQCVARKLGGKAALVAPWRQAAEGGKNQPLQVHLKINSLNYRGTASARTGSAEWSFGPYKEGLYWVETADFGIALPPHGSHRLYSAGAEWHVRIRYTSPQGWTVETPELTLPLEQGAEVRWEKPLKP